MKKVFIGLLVVAAGVGIFLACKSKKSEIKNEINKDLVVGKWKADAGKDSAFSQYRYDFLKDGNVIRALNDSTKADTAHYSWNKDNELVWSESPSDSNAVVFKVIKLTKDSFEVQSKDSTTILFTKIE